MPENNSILHKLTYYTNSLVKTKLNCTCSNRRSLLCMMINDNKLYLIINFKEKGLKHLKLSQNFFKY